MGLFAQSGLRPANSMSLEDSDIEEKSVKERELLYEAYNSLHSLAQEFDKPLDFPAVIVVGHQTSGKSALIEALMGFQFNQVGGGTKTRRPIALRMQYNPSFSIPVCYLTLDNGKEEMRTLEEIQAFIESENKRLEADPSRCFDSREINIRMEYRNCPNMIVIDTPGMIHPPRGKQLTTQQRQVVMASKEAELLVLSKIRNTEYIILCVEDTIDWKHATTRNIVMQADPLLQRTVLVTTKLDTKLPQFSESEDVCDFLSAPSIRSQFPSMLGGPFFTSVPAGRVGSTKDFDNNEAFVSSLKYAERSDRLQIVSRLGSEKALPALQCVGVSKLRAFLEARVEEKYRRNVQDIVPRLVKELGICEEKLRIVNQEIDLLSSEKLQHCADEYRESFAKQLQCVIKGTVKLSPSDYGETLENEQSKGGSFLPIELRDKTVWKSIVSSKVGNGDKKLYGGAQYHRALREFGAAVRHMPNPHITADEIANAAGMGETHNGVNFLRAACVIAMDKANQSFEPVLNALRVRLTHVMKRLFPIVEIMVRQQSVQKMHSGLINKAYRDVVQSIFENFIEDQMQECIVKCTDDLEGMTGFVTWDVEDHDSGLNWNMVRKEGPITPSKMIHVWNMVSKRKRSEHHDDIVQQWKKANVKHNSLDAPDFSLDNFQSMSPDEDALSLIEQLLVASTGSQSSLLIGNVVQFIVNSWKSSFVKTVTNKFNCFFLVPFLEKFPAHLRAELEKAGTVKHELFDIGDSRRALLAKRNNLIAEKEGIVRLQQRFENLHDILNVNCK